MDFAERMLRKYGWDEDKGLGKDNQGMKTAIKPVLKFDTRGVGCNQKDEYSNEFKWWEYTYNRAAKKISQSREQSESEDKQNKKRKHDEDKETKETSTKSIYSRFEKGSILTGNKEESLNVEKETVATEINVTPMPSDEDLLRICGGRTAHKGARHGIKMNGKLQRLQEQEERIFSSSSENCIEQTAEKKKKKKKRKSIEADE